MHTDKPGKHQMTTDLLSGIHRLLKGETLSPIQASELIALVRKNTRTPTKGGTSPVPAIRGKDYHQMGQIRGRNREHKLKAALNRTKGESQ